MPTVESTHGYSQGSQETYVFASSWKNGGEGGEAPTVQDIQSGHSHLTNDHSGRVPQPTVGVLYTSGEPTRTPNEKQTKNRKGYNRLITNREGEI